jgi:hypothetical protein
MYAYEPTDDGTWITARIQRPRSTKDRTVFDAVRPMLDEALDANVGTLGTVLAEEMARRAEAEAGAAEPALVASANRNLLEPVDSAGARSS